MNERPATDDDVTRIIRVRGLWVPNARSYASGALEDSNALAEVQGIQGHLGTPCGQEIADRLAQHPIGKLVYGVCLNDKNALDALTRRIIRTSWRIPPYRDDDEKKSVVLLHLWVRIREETQRAHPRGVLIDGSLSDDVVLQLAMEGKFETLPYEVKMRLIDDARKAVRAKAWRGRQARAGVRHPHHRRWSRGEGRRGFRESSWRFAKAASKGYPHRSRPVDSVHYRTSFPTMRCRPTH